MLCFVSSISCLFVGCSIAEFHCGLFLTAPFQPSLEHGVAVEKRMRQLNGCDVSSHPAVCLCLGLNSGSRSDCLILTLIYLSWKGWGGSRK